MQLTNAFIQNAEAQIEKANELAERLAPSVAEPAQAEGPRAVRAAISDAFLLRLGDARAAGFEREFRESAPVSLGISKQSARALLDAEDKRERRRERNRNLVA